MEWREEILYTIIAIPMAILLYYVAGYILCNGIDFIENAIKKYKWKKFMKFLDRKNGKHGNTDIAHDGLEKFVGVLKKRD